MTDLATIRIPVDSSDMVQAVRDAKALESNVNTLVKAFDSGAITSGQFQKGLLQLKNKFKDLFTDVTEANLKVVQFASNLIQSSKAIEQAAEMRNWFSAQRRRMAMMQESERIAKRQADEETKAAERIAAAQEKATQAIIKQRAAAEQAASSKASSYQAGIGSSLGLGAQGISAASSASAFEQEIERLRQKYDQIYSASRLYESSLEELNKAHMLGITSIKQHESALEQLNAEYQAFQNGTATVSNRFAQNVQQNAAGLNNVGVLMQQVGYQAGDFIVQVQSGTNAFVAFGQQATQLVGFLPMLAAEAGIAKVAFMGLNISMSALTLGLSIVIPLVTAIGATWMRTTESSDKASDSVNRQAQAYQNLINKVDELQLKRQAEASGVTQDEQTVQNNINQLLKEREDLQNRINSLTSESNIINSQGATLWRASQLEGQREALQAELDIKQAALDKYQAEFQESEKLARLEKIRANEILDALRREKEERERLKQAHADQVKLMGDQLAAQGRMKTAAEAVLEKYGMMRTVAAGVANELARAADETFRMSSLNYGKIQNTAGSGPDAARSQVWATMPNPFGTLAGGAGGVSPSTSKTGGTGGGSKVNPIESLINQLQTERETIDEWYATSQDALKNASESELQIIGGYNEAKLRLEKEYQDRLKGIRDEGHSTLLSDTGNMFSALASISEAGGKRALKAQAVLSAAATMIAAYETAVKAAAEAKTIPGRIAAYAGFLASGMKAVSAIRSIGGIGGGTGGGVGSATVANSSAPAQAPQTVYIDSIKPESLYSGETLIKLFDSFYDENDKRGKVFMVAR